MHWVLNYLRVGLPVTNSHNSRFANLSFHIPHAGVLHGLAGYFEAVLYGSVGLSIHPQRKDHISKDMISWFPIYFPFRASLPFRPFSRKLIVTLVEGSVVSSGEFGIASIDVAAYRPATGVV